MNKVQVKRLLNVAQALRDAHAAKKKFDMEKYVFGDECAISEDWDEKTCSRVFTNDEANFCGTPACALGHYAARTDLQRLLKVSILKDYHNVRYAAVDRFGSTPGTGWSVSEVVDHFGIEEAEFYELFDFDGCGGAKTPLQAARYIERFVKQKQFPGRHN